jgi:hypothetical protein
MPFTPPTTYASQATTGYEAQFSMGSPLVPLIEVKHIKPSYYSTPEVNVSHLLSPSSTEELRPGLLKPGTVEVGGNLIGDSSQLAITTAAKNNAAQNPPTQAFTITAPVQNGTKTYTCVGVGYVAGYEVGPFELNKAIEFMMRLQITGIISETVA